MKRGIRLLGWAGAAVLGLLAWWVPTPMSSAGVLVGLLAWACLFAGRVPWLPAGAYLLGVGLASLPETRPLAEAGLLLLAGAWPLGAWVERLRRDVPRAPFLWLVVVQPAAALAHHLPAAPVELPAVLVCSALAHAGVALVRREPSRAVLSVFLSQSSLLLAGAFAPGVGRLAASMMAVGAGAGLLVLLVVTDEARRRFAVEHLAPDNGLGERDAALGAVALAMGWLFVGLPGGVTFFAEDLLFHGLAEHSLGATLGFLAASGFNAVAFYRVYVGLFGGVPRVDVPGGGTTPPRILWALRAVTAAVVLAGVWPSGVF